jgi:hypothetical protein
MKSSDWMPSSRLKILAMAKNWLTILLERGSRWGGPGPTISALKDFIDLAEEILQIAMSSERTMGINEQCRKRFGELKDFMRDTKRRYFLIPPLETWDLVDLGLTPPSKTSTEIKVTISMAGIELFNPSASHIGFRFFAIKDSERDEDSEHGFGVRYGILPPAGRFTEELCKSLLFLTEEPMYAEELPSDFFNRRKRYILPLDYKVPIAGSRFFASARFENSKGGKGLFGKIVEGIIT